MKVGTLLKKIGKIDILFPFPLTNFPPLNSLTFIKKLIKPIPDYDGILAMDTNGHQMKEIGKSLGC